MSKLEDIFNTKFSSHEFLNTAVHGFLHNFFNMKHLKKIRISRKKSCLKIVSKIFEIRIKTRLIFLGSEIFFSTRLWKVSKFGKFIKNIVSLVKLRFENFWKLKIRKNRKKIPMNFLKWSKKFIKVYLKTWILRRF